LEKVENGFVGLKIKDAEKGWEKVVFGVVGKGQSVTRERCLRGNARTRCSTRGLGSRVRKKRQKGGPRRSTAKYVHENSRRETRQEVPNQVRVRRRPKQAEWRGVGPWGRAGEGNDMWKRVKKRNGEIISQE